MLRYLPACVACRTLDEKTYYIACQGCQARRQQAMAVFRTTAGVPLPPASTTKPEGGS